MTSFRITGLPASSFTHLYGLDDTALAVHGVKRYVADTKPGFTDRIEMRDLEPGERALQTSQAIFVRVGAFDTYDRTNELPDVMRIRQPGCARSTPTR